MNCNEFVEAFLLHGKTEGHDCGDCRSMVAQCGTLRTQYGEAYTNLRKASGNTLEPRKALKSLLVAGSAVGTASHPS